MNQDILVSVIVPVYNVEAYLKRCVDTILAQTYANLEIILVDDGSKDSSGQICDELAEKDSRIKVIHKENGGLSSARNAGIDIARGEYFGFVDSDDWIEPDTYEQFMRLAKEHGVKMVCGGRYDVDDQTGRKTVGLCPPREEVISGEEMLARVFTWNQCDSAACDKLFHRSLFADIRYPLGKVSEDVAVFYRFIELADRVALCSKPLYNYFHRSNSISRDSLSEKTFHFESHTRVIYPYVSEKYPKIRDYARYFRVRALVYSIQRIDFSSEENRKRYASFRRELCGALREHIGFVLRSPLFGKKERLIDLLLYCNLYRPVFGLYKRMK